MIDKKSDEYVQFEKLWDGVTPKGNNISKKNAFRSKMKNSCHQEGLEFSKINSFLVYTGNSKPVDPNTILKRDVKVTNPPRRHLRKF